MQGKLAAHSAVQEISNKESIIHLSLKHNILTSHTSFLAVEERTEATETAMTQVIIPLKVVSETPRPVKNTYISSNSWGDSDDEWEDDAWDDDDWGGTSNSTPPASPRGYTTSSTPVSNGKAIKLPTPNEPYNGSNLLQAIKHGTKLKRTSTNDRNSNVKPPENNANMMSSLVSAMQQRRQALAAPPSKPSPPKTAEDKLADLVNLQSANGSWKV